MATPNKNESATAPHKAEQTEVYGEEERPPIPPPRRKKLLRQRRAPVLEPQPAFGMIPRPPSRRVTETFAPFELEVEGVKSCGISPDKILPTIAITHEK